MAAARRVRCASSAAPSAAPAPSARSASLTARPAPPSVVGAGPGGGPHVIVYDQLGFVFRSFFAYDPAFRGGVRVATADLTGDGLLDTITVPGPGGGPVVRVWDGHTGALVREFNA